MRTNPIQLFKKQEGIALLVTLLLMGVLLAIGASLINITLKQYQFSGMALASETAFQVANAGMECILYHDNPKLPDASPFDVQGDGTTVPEEGSISCMNGVVSSDIEPSNNGTVVSGEEQLFRFEWGSSPTVCSEISIYKFHSDSATVPVTVDGVSYRSTDCPIGGVCTVVKARGYNASCSDIISGIKVVEREYTQVY